MYIKKVHHYSQGNWDCEISEAFEHPVGNSMTVPDEAMSINEILEKFTHGIDVSDFNVGSYSDEDEIDMDDDVSSPIDYTEIDDKKRELDIVNKDIKKSGKKTLKDFKAGIEAGVITEDNKEAPDEQWEDEADAPLPKVEPSERPAKKKGV